nr:MAG TPA: hypothetical protein [Caudoviricetes sp.]
MESLPTSRTAPSFKARQMQSRAAERRIQNFLKKILK